MEFLQQRKSHTSIGEIYFWTATIHKWQYLLESDSNKQLIVAYLKKLSDEGLITVYSFVIMPNHIHLVWQQNKLNFFRATSLLPGNVFNKQAATLTPKDSQQRLSARQRAQARTLRPYLKQPAIKNAPTLLSLVHAGKTQYPIQQRYLLHHLYLLSMAALDRQNQWL
jgi:REP element-mobilizing transposase RayT